MKNFLALSLLLVSGLVQANCASGEYLDLRAVHQKIFKKVPVKDQGNYGLCYAYAGTTLVDFFRLKSPEAKMTNISPLEAGLISTIYSDGDGENGGFLCDVVNSLSARGKACTDSAVGSEARYQELGTYFHTNIVQKVFMPYVIKSEPFKSITSKEFHLRKGLTSHQQAYLSRFDDFYKSLHAEMKRRSLSVFPSASEVFHLAQNIHIENRYNILSPAFTLSIVRKHCANNMIPLPTLYCKNRTGNPETLIADLDHDLNNKQPVGISYCSVMLTDRKIVGLDYSGGLKPHCKIHASVIIGRKADSGGRCHYLIRNSWGDYNRYDWPTSQGDIWVSEYMLKRNLHEVHLIR